MADEGGAKPGQEVPSVGAGQGGEERQTTRIPNSVRMEPAHPPVIFGEGVSTYGVFDGVHHITLVQTHLIPTPDGGTQREFPAVAALRLTHTGATMLRDALNQLLQPAASKAPDPADKPPEGTRH